MSLPPTPASLPRPIAAFVTRSKELAAADPIIAYFCQLHAVEQILGQGLHASDDAIAALAMALLDQVEAAKSSSSQDFLEVIQDKDTSVAYVLNFANKIFGNALMAIQEQRSSKQTAMSLMAVVNFYELLQLWKEDAERIEEIEEISKKTKYAKFHAARILKAYKNGEDPNDYAPPKNEFQNSDGEQEDEEDVFETGTPKESEIPVVEPDGSNSDNMGLPSVPTTISQSTSPQGLPKFIDDDPEDFDSLGLPQAPTSFPDEDDEPPFTLPEPPKAVPKSITPSPTASTTNLVSSIPTPRAKPKEVNVKAIMESSEIYTKAQKAAKFAISAMNYEDKETAMKELQKALELLSNLED